MSVNTGYIAYLNLEEYFLDNGEATGVTTPNILGDPNYIPPSYNTILCPLPSVTPSITPTPSLSPSSSFQLYLNAKINGILLSDESASVHYKINAGSWNYITDIWDGACTSLSPIPAASGDTIYLAMTTGSQDIGFQATESNNCSNLTITPYCGKSSPYSIYIDGNKNVSLGAKVTGNYLGLCNVTPPTPSVTPSVTPTITVTPTPTITPTNTPSISITPTPSTSIGAIPTITSVNVNLYDCYLKNDYIGYSIDLDIPALVDVNYILQITMYSFSTNTFSYIVNAAGTIPAGQTTDVNNSNPCGGSGGIAVGGLYYPYSACLYYIDSSINNSLTLCYPSPTPSGTPIVPAVTPTPTPSPSI